MGWEKIHWSSQTQFALVLYNVPLLQFNTDNYWNKWDLSWIDKKKHETMLNGKFACYKLKANLYINMGNVDPLFLLRF
jgi:hypothetical protein